MSSAVDLARLRDEVAMLTASWEGAQEFAAQLQDRLDACTADSRALKFERDSLKTERDDQDERIAAMTAKLASFDRSRLRAEDAKADAVDALRANEARLAANTDAGNAGNAGDADAGDAAGSGDMAARLAVAEREAAVARWERDICEVRIEELETQLVTIGLKLKVLLVV